MPGDGPVLLGMPDIKLLNLLKIMCEVVEGQQPDRKFDFQIIQPSNGPSSEEKTADQDR